MTSARRRLLGSLRPRASRGQLLAGMLCAVLGFALVVQARSSAGGLPGLRQSELVNLLASVTARSTQLEQESRDLQARRELLLSATDRSQAAQQAARDRLQVLGILAGTAPATGPGIILDIADPRQEVTAAILLDTLEELRDAGAEAVQFGGVRVVASTSFVDTGEGVRVDGTAEAPPYRFLAIGDPATLRAALGIPGGVIDVLHQHGATGQVRQETTVTISALRGVQEPKHARPLPASTP